MAKSAQWLDGRRAIDSIDVGGLLPGAGPFLAVLIASRTSRSPWPRLDARRISLDRDAALSL